MNALQALLLACAMLGCNGPSMYDVEHYKEIPGGSQALDKLQSLYCDKKPKGRDCSLTDVSLVRAIRIEQNGVGAKRVFVTTVVGDGRQLYDRVRPLCVALTSAVSLRDYEIAVATSGGSVARSCRVQGGSLVP